MSAIRINLLTGFHLTAGDRSAINAMIKQGISSARRGRTDFTLDQSQEEIFTFTVSRNECRTIGSPVMRYTDTYTFTKL